MLIIKKRPSIYLALSLVLLCCCREEVKNNPNKPLNPIILTQTPDTLVYQIVGVLPDANRLKAEKWASEKYGFKIDHSGCETSDSIALATQNNNRILFAWLNKRHQIRDEQALLEEMVQYTYALKKIHLILDGFLKKIKIGSRKNHHADLFFAYTDSTQKEFMVKAYDLDGTTGKHTGNAVVFRVNIASKTFVANPDE
ncbi:hypothetical protein ACFSNA_07190 [Pedobacter mendelii]